MSYTDVDTVRRRLTSGTITLPSTDDDLLEELIVECQAMIDAFTGRTFEAAADSTRYFDALSDVTNLNVPGRIRPGATFRTLWLGGLDLATTPTTIVNGDGAEIPTSAIALEPRNVAPYHSITLKSGTAYDWTYGDNAENAIAIAGRWAYSVEVPAAIKAACNRLVVWRYRQREGNGDTDRPIVTGDGVTILPAALPKDVLDILHVYRRLT